MTLISTLALLAGCSGSTEPAVTSEPARRPDVLLVTLDTTRADRVGAYGHAAASTPVLDGLAAKGQRYTAAWSPAPLTVPAHATILTGLDPWTHQVRDNNGATLSADVHTLAEVLDEAGYQTAASVGAWVTSKRWGFDQGFDTYFDPYSQPDRHVWLNARTAGEVVDDALGWLDTTDADQPRFLWAHFYDPHFPYSPPEPFKERFKDRLYDGEIAYVDAQVGRLVEAFAERPTVVVVTADHGESLGEHGEQFHGLYVYDATQRVPLLISGPGVEPAVIDRPTALSDIAPTIQHLVGLTPSSSLDGRPAHISDAQAVGMEAWQLTHRFSIAPHRAVVVGTQKLIGTPRPELYDLAADPHERADLASAQPGEVERLQAVLTEVNIAEPETVVVDASIRQELAALGYVQGGAVQHDGAWPDPKDRQQLVALVERLDAAVLQRDSVVEVATLEQLMRDYPQIAEFRVRYVRALSRSGASDAAVAAAREARELFPEDVEVQQTLARMLVMREDYSGAAEVYKALAVSRPDVASARTQTISALARDASHVKEAMELGLTWVGEHPDDYRLAGAVGVLLVRNNRAAEGMPLVEEGTRAERPPADVYRLAALRRLTAGDRAGAADYLARELARHPDNRRVYGDLLRFHSASGDWAALVPVAEQWCEQAPTDAAPYFTLAQAQFNLGKTQEARVALDRALELAPGDSKTLLLDANLLAKEGHTEAARARFEEAKLAKDAESVSAEP